MNISILISNFDFWSKFRILMNISIFYQHFDFWSKFRFLTKISNFAENFDVWWKFRFLMKISIFHTNFDFWPESSKQSFPRLTFSFWRDHIHQCAQQVKLLPTQRCVRMLTGERTLQLLLLQSKIKVNAGHVGHFRQLPPLKDNGQCILELSPHSQNKTWLTVPKTGATLAAVAVWWTRYDFGSYRFSKYLRLNKSKAIFLVILKIRQKNAGYFIG